MQLKEVELAGFKSFADKTRLSFDGGITAIVGPNGCGKSNVVDAVRWVLGEQSAKSLRADSMGDCIFAGTSTRKGLGYAEVSLTFDNSSGKLPLEYEEVAVTRRVYGSGEGEYFINRKPCRLRDIKELFMGTGVGTSAYSVIEQGEITRIVSSDPKELRTVFDEAAGICLYKARLKTATAKLDRVSQNLLRVADILGEVEKRLRSVQYQAAKARRYRNLTARLKELKLDRARRTYAELTEKRAELSEILGRKRSEVERLDSSLRDLETRNDAVIEKLQGVEAEIENHSRALSLLDAEVADLTHTIELSGERIAHHEQNIARLSRATDARRAELEAFEKRTVELEARSKRTARRTDRLSTLASRASGEERALCEQDAALSSRATAAENEAVETMRAGAKLNNRLSEISAGERLAIQQRERLTARLDEISRQTGVLDNEKRSHTAAKEALSAESSQKKRRLTSLGEARAACRKTRDQLDQLVASSSERLAGVRSRRELLEDLQRRRDGISSATRGIFDMKIEGTRGLVAELLEVPRELAVEVESLLGEDAGAIVMETTEAALRAVNTLAHSGSGRAKVISLERAATHCREPRAVDEPGLGSIADRVGAAPGCEAIVTALLGDSCTAESLEAAIAANGRTVGMRIATPAGEVVTADGGITGGSAGKAGGLIWRKAEIERLAGFEKDISEEVAKFEARRAEVAAQAETLAERQRKTAEELADLDQRIMRLESAISAVDGRTAEFARERGVVETEIEGVAEELGNSAAEREAINRNVEESRARAASLEEEISGIKRRRQENSARRERVRSLVTRVKVRLASALEKQSSLERSYQEAREALEEKAAGLEAALADMSSARAAVAEETETQTSARERLISARREANGARVVVSARQRESKVLREETARLSPGIRESRVELDAAREELSAVSIDQREAAVRLSEVMSRAAEEMGASEEELKIPAEQTEDADAVDTEIADINRKLGSMGGINFEALEELDELQQRHEFLSGQRDDLVSAKESLEGIIAKTRATSRKMFLVSFESVREHFAATFRRLFGGGRADCVLVDPTDVLESPIHIMAKPPGKELSNLNLLSGGEKAMTAVALLFAMFATRPSPFLVLDEVDAPLDESNIGRFIELMKDFLPTSQFVVITHNRRTMAAADTLYGVTMEERGVSKKVSVSFREALEVAEPVAV